MKVSAPIGLMCSRFAYVSGSAFEGLRVIEPDEFDYAVLLHVDCTDFNAIEGRNAWSVDYKGYWKLTATRHNRQLWEKYLDNDVLSPNKVDTKFQSAVDRFKVKKLVLHELRLALLFC